MQPGFQAPSGGVRPLQAAVRPLLPAGVRPLLPAGVRPQEQAGADPRQSPAGPHPDSQLSQVSWLQVLLPPLCLHFLARLHPRDVFPRMCRMCVFLQSCVKYHHCSGVFTSVAHKCMAVCMLVVMHLCATTESATLAQPLNTVALIHADCQDRPSSSQVLKILHK